MACSGGGRRNFSRQKVPGGQVSRRMPLSRQFGAEGGSVGAVGFDERAAEAGVESFLEEGEVGISGLEGGCEG